ncbi:MAG: phage terminase large subunit [Epibacterium sp.]|nr:phage terminase large subunit [Epibacterium sp.]NQX73920.1 PBSX family phage terminase large subunit [Epibacterium sp.]
MAKVQIDLPPKMVDNFAQPAKHRVFKGGRGSGKTRSCAKMTAVYGRKYDEAGMSGVLLCSREHLNSLEESSLEEIKAAIRSEPWLAEWYEIGDKYVRTKSGRISYAFAGLRRNLDSIKSKASILLNWTDEAEGVADVAWRKMIPTLRGGEHIENWLSYNPESPDSATHKRFIEGDPPRCVVTHINWYDNPWWRQSGLEEERLADLARDPTLYAHTWEGDFLTMTDAQVFGGKWAVEEFEPDHGDPKWSGPFYGGDFGFSQDPTAAVEVWTHGDEVCIRRETFQIGLELDDTAAHVAGKIPGFEREVSRWDSARPESISYLKRHGLPRIQAVNKWQGSVEDGIKFLRAFRRIVIHPDCPGMAREARLYSYKVNDNGDVTTKIVDANNHGWDAVRYSLAPQIQAKGAPRIRRL